MKGLPFVEILPIKHPKNMKKQILIVLLSSLSFFRLISQTEFLSDSAFIRQHKISAVMSRQISPFDLYSKSNGRVYLKNEYNIYGLLVKETRYRNNEWQSIVEYSYNEKKKPTQKITTSKGNNKLKHLYLYNDKGELSSMEYYRYDQLNYQYRYEYENGKLVQYSVYYQGKDRQDSEKYTYKDGRLHTVAYYGTADTMYAAVKLHYDANSNEVWREVLTKGKFNSYPKKTFNSKNELISVDSFDPDGKKINSKEQSTWKDGLLIKRTWNILTGDPNSTEINCTYLNGLLSELKTESTLTWNRTHTVNLYTKDSLLSQVLFYSNEKVTQKTVFSYNGKKQLIKKELFSAAAKPVSLATDTEKGKAGDKDSLIPATTIFYTYGQKGDTLIKKTIQHIPAVFNSSLRIIAPGLFDTTVYDFREQKELGLQYGGQSPEYHFIYGSLEFNLPIDDMDWKKNAQVQTSFTILDTLKNTVKDGKGELVLKLQVSDAYGRKTKHRIRRSIRYEAKDVFVAFDTDSLNVTIMKLEVKGMEYRKEMLVSRKVMNDTAELTYNYTTAYGPLLSETLTHDKQKRPLKKIIYSADPLYPAGDTIQYDYSKPGEVIESEARSNVFKQTKVHSFNDRNQQIREVVYDSNGQISSETEFLFSNGQCSGTKSQMPSSPNTDKYEYEFFR
jgi:hypothetical protein